MFKALVFAVIGMLPLAAHSEPFLLMAEEDGCFWCAKWNEEIAPVYPKTIEGKTAPLHRYDIHGEAPNVVFERSVHFTPSFILVDDGKEVGRIEGYPGEDFFWGLLKEMFEDADIPLELAS